MAALNWYTLLELSSLTSCLIWKLPFLILGPTYQSSLFFLVTWFWTDFSLQYFYPPPHKKTKKQPKESGTETRGGDFEGKRSIFFFKKIDLSKKIMDWPKRKYGTKKMNATKRIAELKVQLVYLNSEVYWTQSTMKLWLKQIYIYIKLKAAQSRVIACDWI